MNDFLQLLNIGLTSGVLIMLIGAAVAYGKLTQKVDNLDRSTLELWDRHNRLNDHVLERRP